jgi:glycosyltransferase involved in cell wall biosynthesis
MLSLPNFVYTVSNNAANFLKQIYDIKQIDVFHNALDENIFYSEDVYNERVFPYMLMVGSDKDEFKCIPDVIQAFKLIKERGYNLELFWITKDEPSCSYGNVYVRPPQEIIGELYRGAAVFASASRYESFSLPVLEAMACGCPVVTTKNAGVFEYACNNYNCLFAEINNPSSIAENIIKLLNDKQLYAKLRENGIKTARKFSWNIIIPELINYYKEIAKYRPL